MSIADGAQIAGTTVEGVQHLEHLTTSGLLRWDYLRQGIEYRLTDDDRQEFLAELEKDLSPDDVAAIKARQRAVWSKYESPGDEGQRRASRSVGRGPSG